MLTSRDLSHLEPVRLPEEAPEGGLLRRLAVAAARIAAVTLR